MVAVLVMVDSPNVPDLPTERSKSLSGCVCEFLPHKVSLAIDLSIELLPCLFLPVLHCLESSVLIAACSGFIGLSSLSA